MAYKVKFRRNNPKGKVVGSLGPFTTQKLALKQAQAMADSGDLAQGVLVTVEKVGGTSKRQKRVADHMYVISKQGDRYMVTRGDPRRGGSKFILRSEFHDNVRDWLDDNERKISKDHIIDLTGKFGIPDEYSAFYTQVHGTRSNPGARVVWGGSGGTIWGKIKGSHDVFTIERPYLSAKWVLKFYEEGRSPGSIIASGHNTRALEDRGDRFYGLHLEGQAWEQQR